MYIWTVNQFYLTLALVCITMLACTQPAATDTTLTSLEAKETKTLKPENSPQATPMPKTINVSKSNSKSNDKTTITCDIDIPKRTLLCEAYPISDDSYPKWSSNIGGWSNSKSYKLQLISESQFTKEAIIQLQLCNESTCNTNELVIDTSLAKPIAQNDSALNSKESKTNQTIDTKQKEQSSGKPPSNPTTNELKPQSNTIELKPQSNTIEENPLAISCKLDKNQMNIVCESNIVSDNSEITWSSNIAGFRHSETYEIRLNKDYQYIKEARIELEKCNDNQCETVFTIIDTEPARPPDIPETTANTNSTQNGVENRFRGCSGSGEVQFEHSPMRFEDFSTIKPYGAVSGAHVTPIDHMYFAMADRSLGRDSYEVRAIQDGVIYDLSPRDINVDTGKDKEREWRMDIAHTCTFHSYFDLLTSLEPSILAEWEKTQGGLTGRWNGIPIKSGQVVGRIGGQTLDFGVYDYEKVLTGFIYPEHYDREPWKIHTVDPFPYFPQEIRKILLDRNLRKVEPFSGKIDHDIDGTLSGNWFELNTNWYAGVNPSKYWSGHLSIAPDSIDPNVWIFATGYWPGARDGSGAADYLIVDPEIHPNKAKVTDGIIKYNLGDLIYCLLDEPDNCVSRPDGTTSLFGKHRTENSRNSFEGTVLLQILEDRLLKMEVFPGKTSDGIQDFTSNATLYER